MVEGSYRCHDTLLVAVDMQKTKLKQVFCGHISEFIFESSFQKPLLVAFAYLARFVFISFKFMKRYLSTFVLPDYAVCVCAYTTFIARMNGGDEKTCYTISDTEESHLH